MEVNTNVINVTVENFQEVIEKSKQLPVFLEFFAEGAEPSQQLAPILQKLMGEYSGKFILARVDVQKNQPIVQQLQVRTLPTIKVLSQGQMVQNLEGPQEEAQLRSLLEQLTMSPIERIQGQIKELIAQNDRAGAIEMLQEVIAAEPDNHSLKVELADLLVMESRAEEARQILAIIPADTVGINKPKNRLDFIDKAEAMPGIDDLTSQLELKMDDLHIRYKLAIVLVADDKTESALEHLLQIMKQDKEFDDQIARKTMIQIFDLLGKGDSMATAYRRKMFALLH
ncbi:MAG: tetratricopeptide repeat protein [Pseudomonadales bacterium]|nr:tetratricopeptide repeat protein [Pseudomonadales bacterium]